MGPNKPHCKIIYPIIPITLNCLPFDGIVFIGSPMVGRLVMKDASMNLSKVILELGGTNPTIVDDTCNLELTVRRLIWAKFGNAGQTCITCNHVYVHEKVYDKFLQEMKQQLTTRLGKDAEESDDYSKIINTGHTKRILKMMEGKQDNIYFQNGQINVEKCFIPPTILVDIPKDHPLVKEEIFGPLLPVLKFSNIDSVIEDINNGEKSLNINYYGDEKSENY
jgi:aldehyde dehydrogenase (NAD+)